jgi:hypothetical protein
MDPEFWFPGVSQDLGQPFAIPMSHLPSQQLYKPMPQTGSSHSDEGFGTPTETRPAKTKKRPHAKSRQGCLNCKARKVKVAPWPYQQLFPGYDS